MNPSYDSPFGSQNPGGQTEAPNGQFMSGQPPVPSDQYQMTNGQMFTPNSQVPMSNTRIPMSDGYIPEQSLTPMSPSGQGDIILTAPQKSKKGLLIAIAICILAIVAAVVIVLINMNKGVGPSTSQAETKMAFSQFANYITDGNESDIFPTADFSDSTYYALYDAIDDRNIEYLETANQLFDKFYNDISTSSNESLKSTADAFKKDWQVVYTYAKNRLYDEDEFEVYYLVNGKTSTKELMDSEYQALKSVDDERANELAEASSTYENILFNRFDAFEQAGCIKDNQIDDNCINTIQLSKEDYANLKEKRTNLDSIIRSTDDLVDAFVQSLWSMAEDLNNE